MLGEFTPNLALVVPALNRDPYTRSLIRLHKQSLQVFDNNIFWIHDELWKRRALDNWQKLDWLTNNEELMLVAPSLAEELRGSGAWEQVSSMREEVRKLEALTLEARRIGNLMTSSKLILNDYYLQYLVPLEATSYQMYRRGLDVTVFSKFVKEAIRLRDKLFLASDETIHLERVLTHLAKLRGEEFESVHRELFEDGVWGWMLTRERVDELELRLQAALLTL